MGLQVAADVQEVTARYIPRRRGGLFVGNLYGDDGAFTGAGADAAGAAGAVEDALEAEAAAKAEGLFGVETLAVVADADAELGGEPVEADVDVRGGGVFETVIETLLDDAEQDELFAIPDAMLVPFRGYGHEDGAGAANALDLLIDGLADIEAADLTSMEAS